LLVIACLLLVAILWFASAPEIVAQEGQSGSLLENRLVISSSDGSSAPTIVIRAYGVDDSGIRINLTSDTIVIRDSGQVISDLHVAGDYNAGVLTVFLIDVPPGVEPHLSEIQQAIERYASPPNMEERVDYVAIYRVEEGGAGQLLAPTNFHNAVRNFFVTPLGTQDGPTALLDSLGGLLDEVESLKPKDDLTVSIVVITDGTDAVSTEFSPDEMGPKAAGLGIPVHTIWLENPNLQSIYQEGGRDYLADVSAESGGVTAQLDQPTRLQDIWARIASFRTHSVIQYLMPTLIEGEHEVILSLKSDPATQATTSVTVSGSAPSVQLDIPLESRELTLENLDEPVELSLSATVSWLDGGERTLSNAQLMVNGVAIQEIDVGDINRFKAEIDNFNYGSNALQVAVVDEQGLRATSPEIFLSVFEGETQVPDEIQAGGLLDSPIVRYGLICLGVLLLLLVAGFLVSTIRRRRRSRRAYQDLPPAGQSEFGSFPPDSTGDEQSLGVPPDAGDYTEGGGTPYLEILDSVTRMAPIIDLNAAEHRLGRSPAQADIAFENDITVSRFHASIVLEGDDYRIYDENSTSGTWVNDGPVPEYGHQLIDGDEIRLGAAKLRYRRP
jgi:hypothetical protein